MIVFGLKVTLEYHLFWEIGKLTGLRYLTFQQVEYDRIMRIQPDLGMKYRP